jgi:two-component system sensor histidine kinase RegB
MTSESRDDPLSMRFSTLDAPQIVLAWLTWLRWLAVVGQVTATLIAHFALGVHLPIGLVFAIIAATFITNLGLYAESRRARVGSRIVPAVMVLDVLLLTAILALTGGPSNPFCTLYIVHVVLAVVLLGTRWTWIIAALSAACYAVLFLTGFGAENPIDQLPEWARAVGQWTSLTLVAVLIAYFIGAMHRAVLSRDQQLAAMRERNERSARFAAVTALAAGAAHELGSPLGTIAVVAKALEIAAKKAGVGDDITEDAMLIRTEVDRCRAILDRMRLEVGDDLRYTTRVVTAQEFIDESKDDLIEDRKRRVRSEVAVGAEQFYLTSRSILRAVGVLLRNAFEASPPDATVLMKLRHDGKNLICEVVDRGGGMPPDVLKRAGEPFFTTKEMGRGMGMGLFLVKLVIENNDGRMELQSTPGQGTLARLVFPARRPPAALPAGTSVPKPASVTMAAGA